MINKGRQRTVSLKVGLKCSWNASHSNIYKIDAFTAIGPGAGLTDRQLINIYFSSIHFKSLTNSFCIKGQ